MGSLHLPDPEAGDMKLNVFPIYHKRNWMELPQNFKNYEYALNTILNQIPVQDDAREHYVTIDSKFFTTQDFLRREGVHVDGNFCADPDFKKTTWGGTQTTWGGTRISPKLKIETNWVSEHKVKIPIGTYISDNLGGIITVSNEVGCRAWDGQFKGLVGNEGDFSSMEEQLTIDKEYILGKDQIWAMSSNTPHETLLIDQGKRRTFMRITLDHKYENAQLFSNG